MLGYAFMGVVALALDRPKLSQGLSVTAVHAILGLLLLSGFWAW